MLLSAFILLSGLWALNADYLAPSQFLPEFEIAEPVPQSQVRDSVPPTRYPVSKTTTEEYEDLLKWIEEDSKSISLAGKLGGAFATAHYAQGGADTAILSIIGQLLVKGMLVYSGGGSFGLPIIHHGPVALDKEGSHYEDCREMFRIYGKRFGMKAKELFG